MVDIHMVDTIDACVKLERMHGLLQMCRNLKRGSDSRGCVAYHRFAGLWREFQIQGDVWPILDVQDSGESVRFKETLLEMYGLLQMCRMLKRVSDSRRCMAYRRCAGF